MDRIFSKWDNESYAYRFRARLEIGTIVGGIPSDPQVATGWLKSKLQETDERIREMVADVMVERSVGIEEATQIVNELKNLNGFKRTEEGVLFIEGRQVKAAIKEAVSVAVAAGKLDMTGWGKTRKWLTNYLPEHVFVLEETIPLYQYDTEDELLPEEATNETPLTPVTSQTGIIQQFVHTHRGSSIQYQERVDNAVIEFTVVTDHPFAVKEWAMIWTTGERNGLGASRSQGYGTYGVTRWEAIELPGPKKAVKKAATATAVAAPENGQ